MTTDTSKNQVSQPVERHVDTPNGRVFVSEMIGDNPAILLMHGYPDDHRIYAELMARLAPRRAVAFDFAGYGRSARTEGTRFSSEGHQAEISAVLDALAIDRAVLVGHDAWVRMR